MRYAPVRMAVLPTRACRWWGAAFGLTLLGLGWIGVFALEAEARPRSQSPSGSPYCQGTYAGDLVVASAEARRQEETTRYSFCVRSTAVYQCAYYGPDGSLMSRRQTETAHGTGFAFRRDGNLTYVLTNEHVTEWPFLSGKDSGVESVPAGCKRVSQTVSIVDDENDSYAKDDIALQRVIVDAELDVAVLKTPSKLAVIPFALGQSASLKVGDALRVRGFPLGAFQAVHAGKVISARELDQEGKWDHWDFVTDAQLSTGNSGSPVLAISCRSQRFELVGIYHAGYSRGQSLNVVVGVDEFRELITTLKPRRSRQNALADLGKEDRQQLIAALRAGEITPLLPMVGHVVGIRLAGTRLLYDIYPRKFPLVDWRKVIVEDLPSTGFGRIGRIWFGNEQGLREKSFAELKPGEQNALAQLVEVIRRRQLQVRQFRKLEPLARRSRAQNEKLRALDRQMNLEQTDRAVLMRALIDLVGHYAPAANEPGLPVSVTLQPPGGSRPRQTPGPAPPAVPAPAASVPRR